MRDFEFQNDTALVETPLRQEVETRLDALAEGHTDITGAAVALEELTQSNTPHRYQARVVVYIRQDNIVAVQKAAQPEVALDAALNAVERQVREQRTELRETWKRP